MSAPTWYKLSAHDEDQAVGELVGALVTKNLLQGRQDTDRWSEEDQSREGHVFTRSRPKKGEPQ
jgi:hypothetical protein